VNLLRGVLSGWAGMNLLRGVLSGRGGANLLRSMLSGRVVMNFDDDVEERSDRSLRKSGQSLRDSGRSQRNNHRPVDDRHQMNHHHSRRIDVFWSHLESKNENILDNKDLDRIDHDELVSTDAWLKKTRRWKKSRYQQVEYYIQGLFEGHGEEDKSCHLR
jgi:hypothetical protein